MIRAALYIMACSTKNRVRRRLARLREPRYLLGAVVGSAYLYFAIFGRIRSRRDGDRRLRRPPPSAFLPGLSLTGPVIGGVGLLLFAAASWFVPFASALLQFTKPEVDLLFPAPLSRRQLVLYKLIRSQVSVLLGAVIFALVYPVATIAARLRGLIAVWLLLIVSGVFFTGIALWRSRPKGDGVLRRLLASAPLWWTGAGVASLVAGLVQEVWRQPVQTLDQALDAIVSIANAPVMYLLLLPYAAIVRPLFADSNATLFAALAPALAVYGLVFAWVLSLDGGLDTIVEQVARQQAAEQARRDTRYRARPIAWILAPQGRPETALVWKSVLQTFRTVERRVIVRAVLLVVCSVVAVSVIGRARGFARALGVMSSFGAAFAVVLGPQILRIDLRQDLQHLEVLKTWPLRAAALVRAELAWPATVITVVAWLLSAIALFLAQSSFPDVSTAWLMSGGVAFTIMTPALVLAQFTVHNALALIFPAWIALGSGRPRGVDAMGQRMILLFGTWLVLLLALAPAALVGGILWFALSRFLGPWVLVIAAAIGAVIVFVEVLLATEALGPAYERLDVLSVERVE